MRKVLLSFMLIVSLFASDKLMTHKKLMSVLKSSFIYSQIQPKLKSGIIKAQGIKKGNMYIIRLMTPVNSVYLYITADEKYTILGNVISNKTGAPLMGDFPVTSKIVKQGISFSFGKGKDIYVVTDPQCPFCRAMEQKYKATLGKYYRVHIILYPLPFHNHAKAMSYFILSAKTNEQRAKRFKETLLGGTQWKKFHPTKAQIAKLNEELAKAKRAAVQLGVRGTPSVYDANFKPLNWEKLKK